MPRHVEPQLEGRILMAARKLWHKGGEKALSMRAVAKAAGTNTPAVYRRFRDREALLRALVESYQKEIFRLVEPCGSLKEVAECYLDFAVSNPREYQLMSSGLLARMSKGRPNLEFITSRSSEWLGATADDHRSLVLIRGALMHGTAMLKVSGTMLEEDFPRARAAFAVAIDVLVANAEKLRT
jgi:Transcriptional regulator